MARHALQFVGPARVRRLLARHAAGDWGDVSALRARASALALRVGYGLLSEYLEPGAVVYVFTEDDSTRTAVFAARSRFCATPRPDSRIAYLDPAL